MLICASVACTGQFFVSVRNVPVSHACRIMALSVFRSRPITFNTEPNSGSSQQPLVGNAGIGKDFLSADNAALFPYAFDLVDGVTHGPDKALSAGQAAHYAIFVPFGVYRA